MTQELGRMQEVDLREVWTDEAGDFTPWLASEGEEGGLDILAETLGMNFDEVRTEESVGSLRADIVCIDANDNSRVLIENQLEKTDHKHLGQLLTYASGLDSVSIIWVASEITDEHRAALDWLNEITDMHYRFFGVEIALLKIDSSLPAPIFKIVSSPNDWSKAARASSHSQKLTITQTIQYDYWSQLKSCFEENQSIVSSQQPRPQHWAFFSAGRSNVRLFAHYLKEGILRVGLETWGESHEALFGLLYEQRTQIHNEMDFELVWENEQNRNSAKAFIEKNEIEFDNKERWDEYCEWMRVHLEKLDNCFRPRVGVLNPDDWTPREDVGE